MAVESHYRNHSDSKSESSSDKWNNSEILAYFKRSQHNLRDAMRGYGMCIDYTSKRIESVSNAKCPNAWTATCTERINHMQIYSNSHYVARYRELIMHQPIVYNFLPVFVSPQFNLHGKSTFFSHITSKWTAASTRVIEGSWRESNLKVKLLKPWPWQFPCQRTGSRRGNLTVKSHHNLWPDYG